MTYRMRKGQYLSWSGHLRSARDVYSEIVTAHPEDMDALTALGLVHFWTGDISNAKKTFETVLKRKANDSFAFNAYLRVLIANGEPSRALELAAPADKNTGGKDAELGLIRATLEPDLAGQFLARASEDPDVQRRQYAFRAQQAIGRGDHEIGLRLAKEFSASHANNVDALMDVANALALADQRLAARGAYEQAAKIAPDKFEPRLGLARMASREGRLSGSLAQYRKIVEDDPESLEGWLGVLRTARLMDDVAGADEAIAAAEKIAPRSAVVQDEKLKLYLQGSRLAKFQKCLNSWTADDPGAALVWRARWAAARGEPVDTEAIRSRLDPLATERFAALARFLPEPEVLEKAMKAPAGARARIARALAVALEPDLARKIAANNPESERAQIEALASGWWAYAATPFAFLDDLKLQFDAQARTIWLADQWQKRLRTMAVEADSPLQDEWWLQRSLWLERWNERWNSAEASEDLQQCLAKRFAHGISLAEIRNAWRLSEKSFTDENNYAARLTRARWRQYRFAFTPAIDLLRELSRDYPQAVEPLQREAAILRASGRWEESAAVYSAPGRGDLITAQFRLDRAEILRRMRRPVEAAELYRFLQGQQFDEAELYRGVAEMYAAESLPDKAAFWLEEGLVHHPGAPALLEYKAQQLRKSKRFSDLAALLEKNAGAAWINPDIVAPALPFLSGAATTRITTAPAWIFGWQWLPFERLSSHSVGSVEEGAVNALSEHDARTALGVYQQITAAKIPDSDAWYVAARLYDFNSLLPESKRAFQSSLALGVGRLDAETGELVEQARSLNPAAAAREFSARLDDRPYERALQSALVSALLRAGAVTAAEKAMEPLIDAAPDDPEVRMLEAQVRSASGRVRQGRALYSSVLRLDPLSYDAEAGRLALADADEFGASIGYEHSFLRDTTGTGAKRADWEDTFWGGFWRRPFQQTFSLEYHHLDRFGEAADQINLGYAKKLTEHWIVRASEATALNGSFIPDWRVGAGASYRLADTLSAELDFNHLHFSDVAVSQLIPGLVWRWHPHFTSFFRVYASDAEFRGGLSNQTLTYSMGSSWEWTRQSWLQVRYSIGDEDNSNLVRNLVGENGFQSIGIKARLGWNHRFALEPSYIFESHRQFQVHSLGLVFGYAY